MHQKDMSSSIAYTYRYGYAAKSLVSPLPPLMNMAVEKNNEVLSKGVGERGEVTAPGGNALTMECYSLYILLTSRGQPGDCHWSLFLPTSISRTTTDPPPATTIPTTATTSGPPPPSTTCVTATGVLSQALDLLGKWHVAMDTCTIKLSPEPDPELIVAVKIGTIDDHPALVEDYQGYVRSVPVGPAQATAGNESRKASLSGLEEIRDTDIIGGEEPPFGPGGIPYRSSITPRTSREDFNCRTWVKEVLKKLHDAGHITLRTDKGARVSVASNSISTSTSMLGKVDYGTGFTSSSGSFAADGLGGVTMLEENAVNGAVEGLEKEVIALGVLCDPQWQARISAGAPPPPPIRGGGGIVRKRRVVDSKWTL